MSKKQIGFILIFNLFMIIKNEPKELLNRLEITPFSDSLFEYWKKEH